MEKGFDPDNPTAEFEQTKSHRSTLPFDLAFWIYLAQTKLP